CSARGCSGPSSGPLIAIDHSEMCARREWCKSIGDDRCACCYTFCIVTFYEGKLMKLTRTSTRGLAVAALMALAACQTAPVQQQAASPTQEPATAAQAPVAASPEPQTQPAAEQGAPVAVLFADTSAHDGWRPI